MIIGHAGGCRAGLAFRVVPGPGCRGCNAATHRGAGGRAGCGSAQSGRWPGRGRPADFKFE